jgi:type I restriction enzyme S subunit
VPEYLAYFMQTSAYRSRVSKLAAGVNINNLRREHIESVELPFVALAEQQRIVDAIDSYLTRLEDAVASLERVQAKLKAYRASVLKAAVEGRLVPTEASLARAEKRAYEPGEALLARILNERRRRWEEAELAKLKAAGKTPKDDKWKAKDEEPVAPDTRTLPELPEGWCWASVDQLTDGARKSGYGVLVPGPDVSDGVPLVRVGDIHDGTVSTSELKRIDRDIADQFAKTYLSGGEVLLSLVGTIGRSAVVPTSLSGANVARAVGVIPTSGMVRSRWVEMWFRSPRIQALMNSRAHEVARKTLNLEDVRSTAVAMPPVCEQDRIIAEAEDRESVAAATASTVAANGVRCARLRQAILRWAFEGKLVDQDSTDEPAETLLARIRAERAGAAPIKRSRGRTAKGAA